jgi:hypothetical protein
LNYTKSTLEARRFIVALLTATGPTCICICSRLLENEFERHKSIRNMDTAMKLHDVGVTLFYHIITLYNDESAFYPPSKQLLTTCIETLGQVSTAVFPHV